jgi:hypothetical protein
MEFFWGYSFVKMESSKLINYLTNMYWTGQGNMVVLYTYLHVQNSVSHYPKPEVDPN